MQSLIEVIVLEVIVVNVDAAVAADTSIGEIPLLLITAAVDVDAADDVADADDDVADKGSTLSWTLTKKRQKLSRKDMKVIRAAKMMPKKIRGIGIGEP